MSDNMDLYTALRVFEKLGNSKTLNEDICRMTEEQKAAYCKQLECVKRLNNSGASTKQKGEALETLVQMLLKYSGNLFEVRQNVRTGTNEIDIVCEATTTGKLLQSRNLILNYPSFLGECKNYGKKVGVTCVGKFACLMQTTAYRLGILFSYHGVTGKGWNDAQGLIRKFYLSREDVEKRFVLVDFSIREFELITQDVTFLDILNSKIEALRLDTDFSRLLTAHPAAAKIGHCQ